MAAVQAFLSVYAVVGTDTLKRDRTLERFRNLVSGPAAFFDYDELTATSSMEEDDAARLLASLNQLPMGGDRRLVVVKEAQDLPAAIQEQIIAYLGDPNPECSALLIFDKLDSRKRLYKAIAKQSPKAIIKCNAPQKRDAPSQLDRMARELGLSLDPDARDELLDRVGANPALLSRSLRTIRETNPELTWVTLPIVRSQVARLESPGPWRIADAVAAKRGAEALDLLAQANANDLISIHLWITRRIREMLVAKELQASGFSERPGTELLAERFGLRPADRSPQNAWRYRSAWRSASRFSRNELVEALRGALDVEDALKGSANEMSALTTWICRICA